MGLVTGLRANLRSAFLLYRRLRDRGHGPLGIVLWRLPQAVVLRGYRKLAYAINDGVLYVQAGGGIVHDSTPEGEWQETQNKARAVLRAAEMVQLGLDAEG